MSEEKADLRKFCIILYAVYALSALSQFFEITLLPGLLALIIAYIQGNAKKGAAKDTPYASHLRWLSRTFWIGTGVIVPVAVVIAAYLIWTFTDISSIANSAVNGEPDAVMGGVQAYMQNNMTKISLITLVTMVPTVVWWMRRCWIGYRLVKEGRPLENVTSWL